MGNKYAGWVVMIQDVSRADWWWRRNKGWRAING